MIEFPKIGEGVETVLEENMIFSMHPHAISEDGQACLYMQDTWLVGADGGEPLAPLPMRIFFGSEATGSRAARRRGAARGTRSPDRGDPGDRELVAADHEVRVDLAHVQARQVLAQDARLVAGAERDVARRVLVEQGLVEDRAERPDPAGAVDEGDLAEAAGAVVGRELAAQGLVAGLGPQLRHPAALEAQFEAAHDDVGGEERHRRADDSVHTLRDRAR